MFGQQPLYQGKKGKNHAECKACTSIIVTKMSLKPVKPFRNGQLLVMDPGGGVCQLKRIGTSAQGTPGGCLLGL